MAISGEIEKLERRWNENPSGLMFAPLAEACRKAGDPARALEILEHGLRVHPDYVPALIVRGRCHLEMGGVDEAQAAFDQALTRDPVNPIALRSLAEVLERMGRPLEAAERIELLLEVDRGNDEARADLERLRQLASALPDTPAEAATAAPQFGSAAAHEAARSTEPGPFTLLDEAGELVFETEEEGPGLLLESPSVPAEASSEVENLSVDPMATGEPAPLEAPTRLPWEPLPEEPALDGYVPGEFQAPAASDDEDPEAMAPQQVEDMIAFAAPVPEAAEAEPGPPEPEPVTAAADLEAAWTPPAGPVLWAPAPDAPASEVPDSPPPAVAEAPPELAEPAPASEPPAMVIPEQPWASGEPVPPKSPEAEAVEWPAIEAAAQEVETLESPEATALEVEAHGSADEAGLEPASIEEPASPVEAAGRAAEDPTLIVTESMAEVFLRQGHVSLALAVYRQLAERSPEAESIREAIRRLEGEVETIPAAPEPVRLAYRAAETGGRSVGQMLRSVLEAPAPVTASTVLPPAIEPAGEPTRADSQPLSLGAVFGDEPAAPPPIAEAPRPSGEPSYDEFFGAAPTADVGATGAPRDPEVEDLRQFNDWLKGLKR